MSIGWQGEADRLAHEDEAAGRPATAWFERLWAAGARGDHDLPWDRGQPNALLVEWLDGARPDAAGRRALVVGAGLGREAGHLARTGFTTTAFDVSPTAVALAAEREPDVDVVVADLLDLPSAWREAFDLVVEIYTVQALPLALREDAVAAVASTVAPGGTLLVVQAVRSDGEVVEGPPWPLTEAEVCSFTDHGLVLDELEQLRVEGLGGRRWRARFSTGTCLMAILIDPPAWPAHGRLWSHLVSDTSLEELHAFARSVGIPERGFERDHYDVPQDVYDRLVEAGARPVRSREVVEALHAAGLRRRSRPGG